MVSIVPLFEPRHLTVRGEESGKGLPQDLPLRHPVPCDRVPFDFSIFRSILEIICRTLLSVPAILAIS